MDEGLFSDSLHFSNDPITHHLTSSQKGSTSGADGRKKSFLPVFYHTYPTFRQPQQDIGVCIAGCRTRSITVACVHFDVLKEIDIIACPCFPAPLQLLCRGLFPCAPVTPSLAVDLRILEFIHLLFVRQSPNQTAWCDAVETFPDGMGYKLFCKNNLRHRFGNVFHWYRVLTIMAHDHISTLITDPSEYLCSHCLLCFRGNTYHGSDLHSILDIIICIDACFTQKCSTNPRSADSINPPNPTPTFFLSDDNVKAMEAFVQSCCRERRRVRVSRVKGDEDHYEEGMHVPVSVLNGCRESFVAADEKHQKASLMALLCRHDRVLWLVNLTSAGEKQHYALALLDQLFKHIPPQMTVGLPYDIGCQLKRSCRKWNLLDDNTLSHISFAIAVFHAYGHQWPCQIFHQRLFVLDVQIHHLDTQSIQGYGHWLHRRWIHCQTKKNAALDSLLNLDIDEDMLRAQWKAQIAHQTRPIPWQSKNKAAEVITTILALEKTLDAYKTSVHELEMQLHLSNARSQCAKTTDTLQHCKATLGTQAKADLEKMKNNTYLTVRLNARAVKICIRDRLRQRKFDLERLERLYRATINAEHKIRTSTQILKLVSTYNSLCTQLRSLIRQWRVPPSTVPPRPIIREGIFLLDVDDEIWQDIGVKEK
ncbi:hypothetical protein DFJ58DRAFT_718722 [Suillus subalutaceus]|uniref:uncharacterized protein n=1 Tax=Suillus subalutaceus TaxID=48586 RepID=UPI001B87CF56|nr:uncharacterized protein DFJ58DRAFT_718722 [Suillus subalutaceus]KAG1838530.1 hypothetical protein DFJ58DRAFT_718722 [Suillus subalutaceus]